MGNYLYIGLCMLSGTCMPVVVVMLLNIILLLTQKINLI